MGYYFAHSREVRIKIRISCIEFRVIDVYLRPWVTSYCNVNSWLSNPPKDLVQLSPKKIPPTTQAMKTNLFSYLGMRLAARQYPQCQMSSLALLFSSSLPAPIVTSQPSLTLISSRTYSPMVRPRGSTRLSMKHSM